MEKKQTCPECDETLTENKKGVLTNSRTGEEARVFICKECDQAYALLGENLAYAPFDASMKPIKEICKVCGKEEYFRQDMTFIIGEDLHYSSYCKDCAVEFLRNWRRSRGDAKREDIEYITHENVAEIANLHMVMVSNEVMSSPEKMKKIMPELNELKNKLLGDIRKAGAKNKQTKRKE